LIARTSHRSPDWLKMLKDRLLSKLSTCRFSLTSSPNLYRAVDIARYTIGNIAIIVVVNLQNRRIGNRMRRRVVSFASL
jgi:hypothetical protein